MFCSSCGTPVMGTNAQLESSSPIPSNVAAGLCYLGGIVIPAVLLASRLSAMASASATPHGLAFPQASFFGGTQLLSATGPWVVGLIFLLIDKRPFVRFHAAQSIAWFVGVMVLNFLASIILGFAMSSMWQPTPGVPGVMPNFTMLRIVGTLGSLLQLAIYIVTFIAMISAFVGKKYYLPGVGDMVEGWVGKN